MRIRPASINYLADASARHVYVKTLANIVVLKVQEEDRKRRDENENEHKASIGGGENNADLRSVHSSDFDVGFPYDTDDDGDDITVCFDPVVVPTNDKVLLEASSPSSPLMVPPLDIEFEQPVNETVELIKVVPMAEVGPGVTEIVPEAIELPSRLALEIVWFLYLNRRRKFLGDNTTWYKLSSAAARDSRSVYHQSLSESSTPQSCKRARVTYANQTDFFSPDRVENKLPQLPSIPLPFLQVIQGIISLARRNSRLGQSPIAMHRPAPPPLQHQECSIHEVGAKRLHGSTNDNLTWPNQALQPKCLPPKSVADITSHTPSLERHPPIAHQTPLERRIPKLPLLLSTAPVCERLTQPNIMPKSVRQSFAAQLKPTSSDESMIQYYPHPNADVSVYDEVPLCKQSVRESDSCSHSAALPCEEELMHPRNANPATMETQPLSEDAFGFIRATTDICTPQGSPTKSVGTLSPFFRDHVETEKAQSSFVHDNGSPGSPHLVLVSCMKAQPRASPPSVRADGGNDDDFEFPVADQEETFGPSYEEEALSMKVKIEATPKRGSDTKEHKKKKSKKAKKHKKKKKHKKRHRDSSSSDEPREPKRRNTARGSPAENAHLSKITPETERRRSASDRAARERATGDGDYYDPRVKPYKPTVRASRSVPSVSAPTANVRQPDGGIARKTEITQRAPQSDQRDQIQQPTLPLPIQECVRTKLATPEEDDGLEIPHESPESIKRQRDTVRVSKQLTETAKRSRKEDDESAHLLCSESFIENYSEAASSLATGSWLSNSKSGSGLSDKPAQPLTLHDSSLLDEIGVDFEIPGKGSILVQRISTWGQQQDLKSLIRDLVKLSALGRYRTVLVILSVDTIVTPSLARDIAFVQGTPLGNTDCIVSFQMVAQSTSLAAAISNRCLQARTKYGDQLDSSLFDALPGCYLQAAFLLQIASSLTATEAIQLLWNKESKTQRALQEVLGDSNEGNRSSASIQLRLAALTQLNQIEMNKGGREI